VPERWLPIPGVENCEVSSEGRVKSLACLVQMKNGGTSWHEGQLLTPIRDPRTGHPKVNLYRDGRRGQIMRIHPSGATGLRWTLPAGVGFLGFVSTIIKLGPHRGKIVEKVDQQEQDPESLDVEADAYGDPVEVFDPTEFIAEDDEL
jgi:hypothetical protein